MKILALRVGICTSFVFTIDLKNIRAQKKRLKNCDLIYIYTLNYDII
jgi:hypothetical protein